MLSILTVAVALYSLTVGEKNISLSEVVKMLLGGGDSDPVTAMLLRQVRLPRVVLGLAVGGSLSLAGVILQGVYHNPLVEPFTLGISGGASLGVAVSIVLGLPAIIGWYVLPLAGFIGALVLIFAIYALGTGRGQIDVTKMLLTGVMVSFVASSAMMLMMALGTKDELHSIVFWTMGSLDEPDTALVWLTFIVGVVGLALSYFFVRPLNAMRLGGDKAMNLGINVNRTVKLLFFMASLLAGVCVAVAGIIGFVGLIVPHLLRMLLGADYRFLLISSFLGGGAFLVLSDVAARTLMSPAELPIGVITGVIGGSIFIIMMRNRRKI
ncbi:MAG: iron ABC transporter permease [Bacteroidales bacterium]|nr:iron ABC transporter permease [Bacteroidales bacterium]